MIPRAGPWAAVLASACLMAEGAAVDAARFRYATPIALPASAQEELAELVLPPQAYRVTRNDLADLRVVRKGDGETVPFLVACATEEREERVRQSVELRLVKAEELDGKRLRVTLEREDSAKKAEPLCGLVIQTTLRDFERRVTVEVSPEGNTWQPVVKDASILDLSRHANFSLKEIRLPAVTQRHIRLTVDRMDDVRSGASSTVTTTADAEGSVQNIERQIREELRPFRIDRVDGWWEQARWVHDARPLVPREVRVRPEAPSELTSRFAKARLICFDAGRVPLERIKMRSAKRVLSLSYILFERTDRPREGNGEWQQVAAGDVTRLAFRDFELARMEITLAESRASAYCLVFTDREGAEGIEVVGGAGPDYRIVFPYGAGQACTLLAGNPEASGPTGYQPEQIQLLLRRGIKPVRAHLDTWSESQAWRQTGSRFFSSEAAWLLPTAVVLAVAVLGCAVVVALRRMPGGQESG